MFQMSDTLLHSNKSRLHNRRLKLFGTVEDPDPVKWLVFRRSQPLRHGGTSAQIRAWTFSMNTGQERQQQSTVTLGEICTWCSLAGNKGALHGPSQETACG
jgi:hypothetical protein